ncbi:MAG: phosphodiesterase/alkaline phosphatase D-like protein [Crocinitomix sp.]|jgi:phosphodiesterase/alkaline phosphatase D-like protein
MAAVFATVPTVMMWDDHDSFDGWGSCDCKLQKSPIFQNIFPIAKRYFETFQIRTKSNISLLNIDLDYSMLVSFRNYEIVLLDNRSKRTEEFIMSDEQQGSMNLAAFMLKSTG